jgi:hypothetical protein
MLGLIACLLAGSAPALASDPPKDEGNPPASAPPNNQGPHERKGPPRERDPDRERGPRGEGPKQPLSPTQVADMLATLRLVHPELADRLENLNQTDPDRVAQMLQHRFARLRELIRLREQDPELFKLRVQDFKMARQTFDLLRQFLDARRDRAPQATLDQLRSNIRELVAQHFAVRQQARAHELAVLEKRIQDMRRDLDQRAADHDNIIDSRVNDLLSGNPHKRGGPDDEGSLPPPPPPPPPPPSDGNAW